MKDKSIFVFFLFLFVFMYDSIYCEGLEELMQLNENNEVIMDTDDMIYKMKTFFDNYYKKSQNHMFDVDKIIQPSKKENNIEYVRNFDLNQFLSKGQNYIDENILFLEKDLKNLREEKSILEEKNLDLTTKNKILNSRNNIASNENNKLSNDYNEKKNIMDSNESNINQSIKKSEDLLKENINKLEIIINKAKNYAEKIKSLTLNEKVFEEDLTMQNNLEHLINEVFKADFESEFYKIHNKRVEEYTPKIKELEEIFKNSLNEIKQKKEKLEMNIEKETESLKEIKSKIKNKLEVFDSLNTTQIQLKNVENSYINTLKSIEETINVMKGKKEIIEENIQEKKKQRKISKKSIEELLDNLERQLDKFNIDKISVNNYRKDISSINKRMKNLLTKENMIFKKNKIKI